MRANSAPSQQLVGQSCPPGTRHSAVASSHRSSVCSFAWPNGLDSCHGAHARAGLSASFREPYIPTLSRHSAHGCQIRSTRLPGSASGPRRADCRFPWARPFLHDLRQGQVLFVRPLRRYYDLVRNPHPRACSSSAFAFMSRSGMPSRTRMRPPRFRTKDVSTCMGSPTGSSSPSHSSARMLPSRLRTGSAPRNSTRFAARYPAHGLPCERFKLSLAASPCITRGRGDWLGLTP